VKSLAAKLKCCKNTRKNTTPHTHPFILHSPVRGHAFQNLSKPPLVFVGWKCLVPQTWVIKPTFAVRDGRLGPSKCPDCSMGESWARRLDSGGVLRVGALLGDHRRQTAQDSMWSAAGCPSPACSTEHSPSKHTPACRRCLRPSTQPDQASCICLLSSCEHSGFYPVLQGTWRSDLLGVLDTGKTSIFGKRPRGHPGAVFDKHFLAIGHFSICAPRPLFLFYCCCDCIRRHTFDVFVGDSFFGAGPRTVGLNV
jgi:hypothetical protein